eukprot:CAMPEP_0185845440 /NCGR_PEP_ID=MMETSP1354-20130828/1421_1 /TAXON_ID=708628 /ORGANISM="Erythrolobus madagascarensis, Strain CCMP3276" /LENGTH=365 /DNA_ID=CAMNT_0028545411 /DNA_START=298 /DNA_END=1395 /DNA_ORIENTATION=+
MSAGAEDREKGSDINEGVNSKCSYGFRGVFRTVPTYFGLQKAALGLSPQERRTKREEDEDLRFDPEHYAADFMLQEEDENICNALQFRYGTGPETLSEAHNALLQAMKTDDSVARVHRLIGLTEYQCYHLLLPLLDILCANAYDRRVTCGERSVESRWTLITVSATFSWLDDHAFQSASDALNSTLRRTLVFPLVRNRKLAAKVAQDTISVLRAGTLSVLEQMLQVHALLEGPDEYTTPSENVHPLNMLYVQPYCLWLAQEHRDNRPEMRRGLDRVVRELEETELDQLGFDLDRIERSASESERRELPQVSLDDTVLDLMQQHLKICTDEQQQPTATTSSTEESSPCSSPPSLSVDSETSCVGTK